MKMSEIIRLVEAAEWTPERCAAYAAQYHGVLYDDTERGGGPVEKFDWHFDPAFDIRGWIDGMSSDQRGDWMRKQLKIHDLYGWERGWEEMIGQEIREPVVLTIDRGHTNCWDGNHRIGACCLGGRWTLPAVVGVARE